MSSIEDQVRAAGVDIPQDQAQAPGPAESVGVNPPNWLQGLFKALGKRSPDKKLAEYNTHPLNWRKDPQGQEGVGQMLRAAEGWAGQGLNLCIVDLIMGWIKYRSAGRGAGASEQSPPYPGQG